MTREKGGHGKAREDTTRHEKAREGTARHEKARTRGHGARGHRIYPTQHSKSCAVHKSVHLKILVHSRSHC